MDEQPDNYVLSGGAYSVTPPAHLSGEPEAVATIRKRIDPDFVPLWLTREYKHENGAYERTYHTVYARYVLTPQAGAYVITGLPRGPRGEEIRLISVIDGLDNTERAQGKMGLYVTFAKCIEEIDWLKKRGDTTRDMPSGWYSDQMRKAADAAARKGRQDIASEYAYRRKNERHRTLKEQGRADDVFVSSTLVKIGKKKKVKVTDRMKHLRDLAYGPAPTEVSGANAEAGSPGAENGAAR